MPQQAQAQTPQQPITLFILAVTLDEANLLIQALDELPGKLSRPLSQKLIMQSNQQPQLIAEITAQHQAAQQAQQAQAAATETAVETNEKVEEAPPIVRKFKNRLQ